MKWLWPWKIKISVKKGKSSPRLCIVFSKTEKTEHKTI